MSLAKALNEKASYMSNGAIILSMIGFFLVGWAFGIISKTLF